MDAWARRRTSIRDIQKMVAMDTGVSVSTMVSRRQDRPVVNARHAAMWLARETNYTLAEIGHAFGGRDHTTVRNAVDRISRLLRTDIDLGRWLNTFQFVLGDTEIDA